ncbi:transcription-repair coupling factor [Microvirga roseola]|uniref:transcription-repair coupling factor n=1 Tax=Microvirga roseola TaxID=2883126 RepID=UPI001E5E5EB6|nr:transcription-repair coupling factor [Microvirga roseola]
MEAKPAVPQDIRRIDLSLPPSAGLHAVRLIGWAEEAGPGGLIYIAEDERRAEQVAQALKGLAPDLDVHLLPPWDCLPYDSVSPSREVMGRRTSVLRRLAGPGLGPHLLITSPAALVQRVPPRETWANSTFTFRAGEAYSQAALETYLHRTGYILDERVDEPGEAAIRSQVIDLFPADSRLPYRAEHDEDRIVAIRCYDPVSQRTLSDVETLDLEPASEVLFEDAPGGDEQTERASGIEHRLPEFYPCLETIFDYRPEAAMVIEERAEERRRLVMQQIADAYESSTRFRRETSAMPSAVAPERLFIQDDEWNASTAQRRLTFLKSLPRDEAEKVAVPRFARLPRPSRALADFAQAQMKAGRKIVLAAATRQDLNRLKRRVQNLQVVPALAEHWREVAGGDSGAWFMLEADLTGGFVDQQNGVAVIAAPDLLGSRTTHDSEREANLAALQFTDLEFRIGDAVIHTDHGIGLLEGIETISVGETESHDTIRLSYAGDDKLMVPVAEIGRIWRYGSASESLTLDKLNGESWPKRREKVDADLQETARRLTETVEARKTRKLEPLVPPGRDYERFVARFPYPETPDQQRAIDEVLDDLTSGRPMDRLVCGDVGFGKTEVALRAAAAAALAGRQVAVAAPTTVLVRQHLRTFERRFAGLGIEVAHLSRLVKPAEARLVKKGLADGSIRVVIGTHALAARGVTFKDLGLLVIDEEQRFGVAHKGKLRDMAAGGHILTLTATPIPRTMQSALVGLQELSIIATPPARRQPIRTFLTAFDPAAAREALMRERRRGGQSFVVCPQVEDIEPMREQLARIVPELDVLVAHGQMPPAETDEAMVRFADGEGDVLLATNIIESGLDVPRANTMLVWRADRFGLSQLHQLRGRVGRGRVRGAAYLLTEPGQTLSEATERRLKTLEALDRLGAGFAISAKDLDQRGAGALLGEEQAGHMKLIGADLYQHMLKRALRGEALGDHWTPELNIGLNGTIPEDYVAEPEVRINLYARLTRSDASETIDDLAAEVEDRFGPMPEPVQNLLDLTNLKRLCLRIGIARIDAGPQAIALTFRPGAVRRFPVEQVIGDAPDELRWSGERLIFERSDERPEKRLQQIVELLDRLEG